MRNANRCFNCHAVSLERYLFDCSGVRRVCSACGECGPNGVNSREADAKWIGQWLTTAKPSFSAEA